MRVRVVAAGVVLWVCLLAWVGGGFLWGLTASLAVLVCTVRAGCASACGLLLLFVLVRFIADEVPFQLYTTPNHTWGQHFGQGEEGEGTQLAPAVLALTPANFPVIAAWFASETPFLIPGGARHNEFTNHTALRTACGTAMVNMAHSGRVGPGADTSQLALSDFLTSPQPERRCSAENYVFDNLARIASRVEEWDLKRPPRAFDSTFATSEAAQTEWDKQTARATINLLVSCTGGHVQRHAHGAAWNELYYGQKQWRLWPPNIGPAALLVTQRGGDVLVVPHGWYHEVHTAEDSMGHAVTLPADDALLFIAVVLAAAGLAVCTVLQWLKRRIRECRGRHKRTV